MNRSRFIRVFFTFFAVYSALNFYIFISGWKSIPAQFNIPYLILFFFLYLAFPVFLVDRLFLKSFPSSVNAFLHWAGSIWIAFFVYFLIAVLLLDIIRLINLVIPFFPQSVYTNYDKTKFAAFLVICTIVFITVAYGYWNAAIPRIKKITININKKTGELKTLKAAVASDIHLGIIVCSTRLRRIVRKINALEPDIILLPGDVIDEDLEPVIKQNLGEMLRTLRSKYGVYAITGNHEYIGGVEPACKYLAEHGITELRDEYIKVDDSFYIIGREDRSIRGFAGKERKPLEKIMDGIDKSYPLILMDHQPVHLEEAEKNGIDLQLSGHTHHGQFFPFNLVTKKMFELSWGYKMRGSTHYYVSCGVGTWGPPVRIANKPEIISLTLNFI